MSVGALLLLDRLWPPDLTRYRACSQVVTDAHGEMLRPFTAPGEVWRLHTTPDLVDPTYLSMLMAYEDQRFQHHPGVDPLALGRAVGQWLRHGRPVSGASTLTMQVVRLLEPRPRTLFNKGVEVWRALQLEWRLGKSEILAIYLTLAPMGGNLEGVRAASLAYFGKEPRHLTTAQAALLTALPQSPAARRPDRHPQAARAGVAAVLARLNERGLLSLLQVAEAAQEPLDLRRRDFPFLAPHLAAQVVRGRPPGEVRTTLHLPLQRALERLVRQAAGDDGAAAAVLVSENASRRVRAYVSGHDFFAPAGQVDLVRAARSPGSALKPFLYGLAMDDLVIHPETLLEDRPLRYGAYVPRNFDTGFHGVVTAREALQQSLNLPAVALMDRVGPTRFAALLRQGGATLHFPQRAWAPGLALALGGVGVSLRDIATLYLHLANGGQIAPLRLLEGEPVAVPEVAPLLSPSSVWHLTNMLAGAPRPEQLSQQSGGGGRTAIAYKTGTSYGFRDAWAFGYSASHTVGVWVGRADGTPRPGAFGRQTAAPLMFQVFDLLHEGGDPRVAQPPPGALLAASNGELPEGLRRFQPAPDTLAAVRSQWGEPPRILFPPDGAEVELSQAEGGLESLALSAEGGLPPLRWVINGRPLGPPARRATARWQPDGEGYARIVLLDALDRRAEAYVRIR